MPGFFAIDERLQELSAKGDDLERINALVDFEIFRLDLEAAVPVPIDPRAAVRRSITCSCSRC
jgi:hypothetical protein